MDEFRPHTARGAVRPCADLAAAGAAGCRSRVIPADTRRGARPLRCAQRHGRARGPSEGPAAGDSVFRAGDCRSAEQFGALTAIAVLPSNSSIERTPRWRVSTERSPSIRGARSPITAARKPTKTWGARPTRLLGATIGPSQSIQGFVPAIWRRGLLLQQAGRMQDAIDSYVPGHPDKARSLRGSCQQSVVVVQSRPT